MLKNQEKLLTELHGLIDKGIFLTHLHPKRDLDDNKKPGVVATEAYSNYISWVSDCCPLLMRNGFITEAEKFTEGDSIGNIPMKIIFKNNKPTFENRKEHCYKTPYSDATRKEAEKLINKIREEVRKKLEILQSVRDELEDRRVNIKLIDHKISFDDETATIFVGELPCKLPPHKHEHCLVRIMFKSKPNIHVEWVDIAEEITGDDFDKLDKKKDMRAVKDTVYSATERVQRDINTKDKLFTWKNKGVIRNY